MPNLYMGLGLFNDSPDALIAAAEYLKKDHTSDA